MADAAEMLTGAPSFLFVLVFAAGTVAFTVRSRHQTFSRYVKWTTMVLLAYVAAAIIARSPWSRVLAATFLPA